MTLPFYFYIALCADGTLYSGSCKNVAEREAKHNSGKGAKYTRARLPVQIIYSEKHTNRSEAVKRECEVKKWTRVQKQILIEKSNKS